MLDEETSKTVASMLRQIATDIDNGTLRVEDYTLRQPLAQRPPENGSRVYAQTGEKQIWIVLRDMDVYV